MNIINKRVISQRARSSWRDYKRRHLTSAESYAAANALLPPLFAEGDITDPADGTLHKDVIARGQGLSLQIPLWHNHAQLPGQFDVLDLEWAPGDSAGGGDFELVDSHPFEGPVDPASFPLTVHIPPQFLRPDGAYRLRYSVMTWNGEVASCEPVPIRCDSEPPFGSADPPPPGIPAEPITDDYLGLNPQGVAWTLPGYTDVAPGDVVDFWWTWSLPDDPDSVPFESVPVSEAPATVHVPAEVVQATGDGGCYLSYRVRDKAGNVSRTAHARLAVALGPLPTNLPPPRVPSADDGVVSLDDAVAGVYVVIDAFDNPKPTDRLEVAWGGTWLGESTLGVEPHFPLMLAVPRQVLRDTYGAAEGAVPTQVAYRVKRGDLSFDAPAIMVDVDFSHAGPELPDWPELVNPELSAPRVFGAVSNQLNVLSRADDGQAAAVRFDLYAPLHAGERLEFYWYGTLVPEATYTVAEADQPCEQREVSIPWAVIAEVGNHPQLPVYYRVRAPDSPNHVRSPTTLVHADAFTLTPPAPSFEALAPGETTVACRHLDNDNALRVVIPDLSEWLGDGDQVTVTWTPFGYDYVELTAAVKEDVLTLGPDHPATGFIWQVKPYETHILPVYLYAEDDPPPKQRWGYATVRYAFTLGSERIHSARDDKGVGMYNAGVSCQLPPA